MEVMRIPGIILTLIGGILTAIWGIMILSGATGTGIFSGISLLILGIGLFILMLFFLSTVLFKRKYYWYGEEQ